MSSGVLFCGYAINGDGDVTLEDEKIFKDYFAGKVVTNLNFSNADIDGDKIVTRKDAMILARFLSDWPGYTLEGEEDSEKLPWEVPGAKQPTDYTYAEFVALTAGQQMAFQNSFGSYEAFDAWLQKALSGDAGNTEEDKLPWEVPGTKQPIDYTYAEFEALTAAQQMAFQNSFGSFEAFDAWLQKAQSGDAGDTEEDKLPWEVPGVKQPIDYTYAEFETLTAAQQMAFQNSFGSFEAFDAWLQKALSGDAGNTEEDKLPWEVPGAKQPIDYTYAEFENLTASQQMAFQNSFGSIEAFDAWLQKAQSGDAGDTEDEKMPWEVVGAKQPEEYIWDEFIALSLGQQIAFQSAFKEADGFEKWLEANEP